MVCAGCVPVLVGIVIVFVGIVWLGHIVARDCALLFFFSAERGDAALNQTTDADVLEMVRNILIDNMGVWL